MLPTLAAALLLPAAAAAAGVQLSRVTRATVEATRGDETYWYEKGIAPDDAGAVHAYLRRLGDSSRPVIVRVPGKPGRFLVSDFVRGTGADVGRCLVLLESKRGEVRELARTDGAGGAYGLRPVVFAGGGRTIVLAEMATEYSWGLKVYEIAGTELEELGTIDAAVPDEAGEKDPTPFARVRLEGRRLVVRFDADLVLGTGKDDSPVVRKPVVFRQKGAGFVRAQGVARARAGR